jgi:hypothetical protein
MIQAGTKGAASSLLDGWFRERVLMQAERLAVAPQLCDLLRLQQPIFRKRRPTTASTYLIASVQERCGPPAIEILRNRRRP